MKLIFGSIFAWLIFVLSLTGWWLYFGITTLSRAATYDVPSQLARHQRMLFAEGCVLMFCLLSGGIALFYFSYRTYKEKSAKEMFFASFTHDLKTSLFRLQLEIEKLGHSIPNDKLSPLLKNTRKLQLDLENGLDSSIGQSKKLFIESIAMSPFLVDLHAQWPDFHIKFTGEETLNSDRKALYSIFKNLLHNSFLHGEADEVTVELKSAGKGFTIHYSDNGKALDANISDLGQQPQGSTEGSGFGLLIVRQWVKKLGGQVRFRHSDSQSLVVEIDLPEVAS